MGANLTSPQPHRSQTSVRINDDDETTSHRRDKFQAKKNREKTATRSMPFQVCNHLFSPGDGGPTFAPQRERTVVAKESVLMQGWNWSKRNIQPVMSRRSLTKSESSSEATSSSKSSDSLVSFTRSISSSNYGKVSISLDKNQNYSTNKSETTVIPNYYSIRDEFRRGLQINKKQDYVNNNLGAGEVPRGAISPKHVVRRRSISDENANSLQTPITELETTPIGTAIQNGVKKTIIQASTSELLRGLGLFIGNTCLVPDFEAAHLVTWLRSVDRALLLQGWQDIAFINPANLVFVFMIVRDVLPDQRQSIMTLEQLHAWILSCLYVSYSYMGNEISYPLKPFLIETDRNAFWSRCVSMITSHSKKMLLLNSSSTFFTEVFTDLKRHSTEA